MLVRSLKTKQLQPPGASQNGPSFIKGDVSGQIAPKDLRVSLSQGLLYSLTSVTFPNSVTTVGNGNFAGGWHTHHPKGIILKKACS
jgi:hypothetical protein